MTAKSLLSGRELSGGEISAILDRAAELKALRGAQEPEPLSQKSVALIFERPSTRTRVSFEVGVAELGGTPIVLRGGELQLTRGESIRDTATVLSRYVQMIVVRTGAHEVVEELAEYSTSPVINSLTEKFHPCQILADLLTLKERFGGTDGLRLAYVGDGNNVVSSLLLMAPKVGVTVAAATPAEFAPDPEIVGEVEGTVELTDDPAVAAKDADAIYTDVWVSMGDADADRRKELLAPYQLNSELMALAKPEAVALHCLPAHPNEEITEAVLYGEQSAIWDQAENRLHTQKALMEFLLP